jgi:hypothetical protein
LVCLLGLSIAATAKDTKDVGRAIAQAIIRNVGLPEVVKGLVPEAVDELATEPAVAREICEAAARYVYRAPSARTDWEPLVERIVALGHATMERTPDDGDAVRACAEAELCRVRLARNLDKPTKTEEWVAVAELFLKAHGVEADEGKPMERAAKVLWEAAEAPGVDRAALRERAVKTCEEGTKQYPQSAYMRGLLYRHRLESIEVQLGADRRAAQKAMSDYLLELRAAMGTKTPEMVVATAYNDAVSFARSTKGLDVKADFITRTLSVAAANLKVEIPVSERWDYEEGRIRQYDREGDLVRSFFFDVYSWNTNYYIGQTQFGGDNLKGLAQLDEMNAEEVVVKITKRKKPARRRFNRKFPSAIYFEVSGLDDGGDFLKYTSYYVKTEKRVSVQVAMLEFKEVKDLDPEAELVVDSFREPD